jgi:hypothetical protein
MAPLAQGVVHKWFFWQNLGNTQLYFNLLFASVLCYQHANLMEEKFLKNQRRRIFFKKNFCSNSGHFEQSRHSETKQNSTFLKTRGYSPYIEVNFCKI